MIRKSGFSRRYRLRHKARLVWCMALVILATTATLAAALGAKQVSGQAIQPTGTAASPLPTPSIMAVETAAVSPLATVGGHAADDTSDISADWRLILVNKDHPLPGGHPPQMRELPNGLQFDARAYDDLMAMIAEGKRQGLSFVICSAYRSMEKQQELFDVQVAVEQAAGASHEGAVEITSTKVAPPGTSEHNLGLAVDIVALDYQQLDEGYTNTPECQWLRENAHRFGFIVRYPEDKSAITGIIFEPWHFRYVGMDAAKAIHENGMCLEEYIASLSP